MSPLSARTAVVAGIAVLGIAAAAATATPTVAESPMFAPKQEMAVPVVGPFAAAKTNVRHIALDSTGLAVKKRNGSYIVTLKGVESDAFAVRARRDKKIRGPVFKVRTPVVPRVWTGRMGFNPNMAVTYKVNGATRTHYLRDLSRPSYNARANSLTTVVDASPANVQAIARMRPKDARSIRAVFEPSPIRSGPAKPGKYDPKRANQTSTVPSTSAGYVASSPNSTFSLPYTSLLGSGGQSWQNVLSANGQYTQGCETYTSSQSAGDALTYGTIQIYETAAEVQQALSVSGNISYGTKMAKVALDAGYSTQTAQSTSSFYAVASVQWNGAVVNLGSPKFSSTYASAASGIGSFNDALGLISACGDSFPTSYNQGASWASVLQITMSSSSDAQSAYANISGSYGKTFSGSASFSGAVSSYASGASITETDECWGPASCGAVPGYQVPSSTDFNAAMSIFTNNYNIMYSKLAAMCAPSGNTANCITEVNYAPIQQAFTTVSFAYNSPQNLVTQAAEGMYGVLQNLQAWSSQYQALITGNPTSTSVGSWQASMNALNQQAQACGMLYAQSPACAPVFQSCSQGMTYNPTYVQPACMPTAFTQNPNLAGMVNPFSLTGAEEVDSASSSERSAGGATASSAASPANRS
jgi:hypothetical protein